MFVATMDTNVPNLEIIPNFSKQGEITYLNNTKVRIDYFLLSI